MAKGTWKLLSVASWSSEGRVHTAVGSCQPASRVDRVKMPNRTKWWPVSSNGNSHMMLLGMEIRTRVLKRCGASLVKLTTQVLSLPSSSLRPPSPFKK